MGATKQSWINRKLNGNGAAWNKGLTIKDSRVLAYSLKQREKLRGVKHTAAHNLKISNTLKKSLNGKQWNSGLTKHAHPSMLKMSVTKKAQKLVGSKSPSWRGGISFGPYSIDWTHSLKISIRERDKYVCQLCYEKQGDIALDVHHIDYDKQNCNPTNLIALCHTCHMRTNAHRTYWSSYFKNKTQVIA